MSMYVMSVLSEQEACRDVNVRVTLTKVFKPDELVVVIHVTNQNQASLSAVTMTIDPPSVMKAELVSEDKMETTMDLPGFGTVRTDNSVITFVEVVHMLTNAWLQVCRGHLVVHMLTNA